jgi:biotin/methionine sulfoxide reductase
MWAFFSSLLAGMARVLVPHSSHWGAFEAEVADGTVVAIRPYRHDSDPSPLLGNIVDGLRHRARIAQPMIRAGWLDRGPGPDARRGAEPFVPVSWTTATDLLARELGRVYDRHGGESVYGGSYGWTAPPLPHAQGQLTGSSMASAATCAASTPTATARSP